MGGRAEPAYPCADLSEFDSISRSDNSPEAIMTGSQSARLLSALVALSLCLGLAACTSTRARRGTPAPSGFLRDY